MDSAGGGVYFNSPGVATVRWDEDGQFVLVEWEGWANSAEFAALLDAEIVAMRKHKCSRLLADCRRQRVLNPAEAERAGLEWVPQALAAGLRRFAVVVPASALAEANLKNSLGKIPAHALEVAYFSTPDEARAWLGS
jgi:hypothetical protein